VPLTEAERQQCERFAGFYQRNQLPFMQKIERAVCGCDFGGTSWTTREEANSIISELIAMATPDLKLLDIGAGSGWPGLYLASAVGDATLVDLPFEGLEIARQRAFREGLEGRLHVSVADARALPFSAHSFDAITHSDLLCCMPGKQEALAECRRLIRSEGRMIFSVIQVVSDLDPHVAEQAADAGPLYVTTRNSYAAMLKATGWVTENITDLSCQFRASALQFMKQDNAHRDLFIETLGKDVFQWRQDKNKRLADVIEAGLLQRHLYVVRPL
jgi:ubiquinone/menaquinone biosynthesis C-methylase UbiE